MPKWTQRPLDFPLIYQPDQQRFLSDRRLRLCRKCTAVNPDTGVLGAKEFSVEAAFEFKCPDCGDKGTRKFDFLTIIAGRRFGKSRFGSIAGVEEACIPNTIGWACAPTVPKLHRYVIPAFEQLIPPEWVADWNKEFGDLRLKNGSLIHFQTLEDPDQGRGQGLDWLWIDEICELSRRHWEVISPSLDDRRGVAFFTTSPRSYDWVYEEFYYPADTGMTFPRSDKKSVPVTGFWALHAKTADNPIFQTPDGKARLEAKRAQMSDLMYRQEFEADFVTFEGAVYGDTMTPDRIINTDEEMKRLIPEWPEVAPWRTRLIGLDTGADHPFGATLMVACEGDGFVVIDEYLERNRTFLQHTWDIRAMVARYGDADVVKYAINKNEKQPLLELGQHGIWPQKAENDLMAGTERVKTWLYNQALWFYAPRCTRTIQQMKSYRYAENISPKDESKKPKEQVFKKNDELPDCIRYSLMTWPRPVRPPVNEAPKRDISKLPEHMQRAIERMRRHDAAPKEPASVVGDFYA